tara:strand:- start:833 stop:979 length:147 start_codon:yes stop_codon:yes gene_type:complete
MIFGEFKNGLCNGERTYSSSSGWVSNGGLPYLLGTRLCALIDANYLWN